MDVEERLARLQRRAALAERLQRQAQTGIEEQPVTTIGSPPRTPAAEAVYEILLAIDPVLRRHAGLTVGIWTTPPPGSDESPDAVAMISVDPVDQTLSLHFPVPPAAHPADVPDSEPSVDADPVVSTDPVDTVDVPEDPGPLSESPQRSEPSINGVSGWADDPDDGEVPELVERAVEHVVGKAAGHLAGDRAQAVDGSPRHAPDEPPPEEAPADENGDVRLSREQLQPLGHLPAHLPARAPEGLQGQPVQPDRGSVAHELAALLRYPDVALP
jgi:hypothetical protein